MPELPDLEVVVPRVREAVAGRRIVGARVKEPIVLRVAVPGDLPTLMTGRTIESVDRRGNFVLLGLGDLELAVNMMLAGRFRLATPADKVERTMCFALVIEGDLELRYLDDKKMGKAYVIPKGRYDLAPGLATMGVEVMSDAFTLERFRALAARRRDQVRTFLMDKSALAAIGNAYADEILFAARIHPKTRVQQLAPAELEVLYQAIRSVLSQAIDEVARRGAPIEEKVRDFLAVRGKKGARCPRCGTTLRRAVHLSADAVFCPECQPARRPQFIDWRKLTPSPSSPRRRRRR